jgi:hypothetical protein
MRKKENLSLKAERQKLKIRAQKGVLSIIF